MRSSINFNHLECFFSLARTLSFSKTSKELTIAQPAVSKQIKTLEEQLQIQLFLRTRQSVQLSSTGKQMYEQIWPLYSTMCAQIKDVAEGVYKLEGKIVFGCLEEVGEKIFIRALNDFKKQNHLIQFEVKFLKAYEIVDGVKDGKIDFGIVPDRIIQEKIRTYEIFDEEIILVTNKQNSINRPEKIATLPLVSYRENDPLLQQYLRKVYPQFKLSRLKIEFSVNSHRSMVEVLKHNNFYAVLPSLSIKNELEKKELVDVGLRKIKSKLYLIHVEHNFMDKKSIAFRDYLIKHAKSYI